MLWDPEIKLQNWVIHHVRTVYYITQTYTFAMALEETGMPFTDPEKFFAAISEKRLGLWK